MSTADSTAGHLDHPRTRAAFRDVRRLVGGYVAVSVIGLVAIVLLRHHAADVDSSVWTRGIVLVVVSLLTLTFTLRAAGGSPRAYLRLRIVSALQVVAIAVILAIPGSFPLWMKLEQGVCGLLLLGVVAIVNGRSVRSLFAAA